MNCPPQPHGTRDVLTSYFWSGDVIRSRRVSDIVLSGTVDVPMPPAGLLADWEREISATMTLDAGDVEAMPFARSRVRWRDYPRCVQAAADWTGAAGLPGVLAASDVALMACRGATYHHDGAQYGGAAFCNLFMSEDKGLDVHFPASGHRIALTRGTVLLFDTGNPHGVIRRGSSGFDAADFPAGEDCTQLFLTWELPVDNAHVAHALDMAFDVDPSTAPRLTEEQVWVNGAPASVCPDSGRWRQG